MSFHQDSTGFAQHLSLHDLTVYKWAMPPSSAGEVQEENCPDGFRAVMDYLRSSTLLLSIRLGFPRQGKGNDWILVGKLTSVTTLGFQPTLEPAGTGLLTG
jgi:hypothetical protein